MDCTLVFLEGLGSCVGLESGLACPERREITFEKLPLSSSALRSSGRAHFRECVYSPQSDRKHSGLITLQSCTYCCSCLERLFDVLVGDRTCTDMVSSEAFFTLLGPDNAQALFQGSRL